MTTASGVAPRSPRPSLDGIGVAVGEPGAGEAAAGRGGGSAAGAAAPAAPRSQPQPPLSRQPLPHPLPAPLKLARAVQQQQPQQQPQQQQSPGSPSPSPPSPLPSPSPLRPHDELHFALTPGLPPPPDHFLPRRTARRMSSVPELREHRTPGLPAAPGMHRPHPRMRGASAERERRRAHGDGAMPVRVPFEAGRGGHRLIRQKSIERGIGLPSRPSAQGKRSASRGSDRRNGPPPAAGPGPGPGRRPPQPPGLNMPLAFNSIARERGFSTSSQGSASSPSTLRYHSNSPGAGQSNPSSSAPDLFNNTDGRQYVPRHPKDPPRSYPHPQPPQPPYSASTSANSSPHSSVGPPWSPDEARTLFRSPVDFNRSSTHSEAATDSSTMTVDEAIGMYASDTDEEEVAAENRRSHGDSVLGGACSRTASLTADRPSSTRSKGDSVLGGEVSPETRSRMKEQEMALMREANRRRMESGEDLSPAAMTRMAEQEAALQKEVEKCREEESREEQVKEERHDGQVEEETQQADDERGSDEEDEKRSVMIPNHDGNLDSKEVAGSTSEALSPLEDSPVEQTEAQPMVAEERIVVGTPKLMPVRSLLDLKDADVPKTPKTSHSTQSAPTPRPAREPAPFDPRDVRDRYGFRKQTQHVTLAEYEEWEARYNETLERRRKKWDQLLQESGLTPGEEGPVRFPPKSAKIKRYVRKGIPPEWRGAAWFWYAGGQRYLNKHPGLYDELVKRGLSSPDSELIERDLHRTFPDNMLFKPDPPPGERASKYQDKANETEMVKKLRRLLVAFSLYVPKIGYCQSLNFLAGLLLLFMAEEKAFWMLYILTHTHLPGTHEVNLEGSSVDQWVLMVSVRESMPHIWAKIGGGLDGGEVDPNSTKLPPVTLCTSAWFMSGFIGSLPIESVLRVWDVLFYEGSKTLFRVAMTIFKCGEAQIKAVNDPMEIFQVVQTIPRKLVDAGALIEACYRRRNGFGHLSQEVIDHRRQERRDVFADERAMIAKGGVRASKDDAALRGRFANGATMRVGGMHHHHNPAELGRKFKKILVKT